MQSEKINCHTVINMTTNNRPCPVSVSSRITVLKTDQTVWMNTEKTEPESMNLVAMKSVSKVKFASV